MAKFLAPVFKELNLAVEEEVFIFQGGVLEVTEGDAEVLRQHSAFGSMFFEAPAEVVPVPPEVVQEAPKGPDPTPVPEAPVVVPVPEAEPVAPPAQPPEKPKADKPKWFGRGKKK